MASSTPLAKLAKRKHLESYVVTAIPVGASRAYIAFNVVDGDDDFLASAVIAVDLPAMTSTILYESEGALIDYVVDAEGWHCVLMADRIVEIAPGGAPIEATRRVPSGLYRMAALGDRRVAICGDAGKVYLYAKRKLTRVATNTGAKQARYQEPLASIYFATPSRGYAVGRYGTFLAGNTRKLAPAWGKHNPFALVEPGATRERRAPVTAVYEAASGEVLLGSDGGPALIYAGKRFTRLTGLAPGATVVAIAELKGVEYWSADDNSLYTRRGTRLRKRPEESGGYRMEASAALLASSAGSFVYFFDGKTWTRVRVNPSPKRLVERLKLDF